LLLLLLLFLLFLLLLDCESGRGVVLGVSQGRPRFPFSSFLGFAAMEIIQQGRRWLYEDGEGPEAVLEETAEQLKAATDKASQAAWTLVSAEALLAKGAAAESLEKASHARAVFSQLGLKICEAAAAFVVADVLLFQQDGQAAAAAASAAVEACQAAGDAKGEASMLLQLARAHLTSMQDPYSAAKAAISSCLRFRSVGDSQGEVAALEVAARAHLLYDPEQALKAAKEASALCDSTGNFKAKASVAQTLAAAKAQIATAQHADQAQSFSCRGDKSVQFKWPKVVQQNGPAAPDLFVVQDNASTSVELAEQRAPDRGNISSGHAHKPAVNFMRKAFKWTAPRHATDEAWYRQELVYLPPPREEVAA